MKLSPIRREDILKAADDLDASEEYNWSEYWVGIPEKNKAYPFKQLIRKAYTHATGVQIGTDFFQSNDNYRDYIEKTFQYPINFKVRDNIPFFTDTDLSLFAQYAGQPYDGSNKQHALVGEQLRKGIFSKTNTWVRALNLDGFEIKTDNNWQRRGVFTKYSWARIYRRGDQDKKIFFTVGVDGPAEVLVYKLDCKYKGYDPKKVLEQHQIDVFYRIVKPTGAHWNEIQPEDLAEMNWEHLIQTIRDFILHYTELYDEVVKEVWNLPNTPAVSGILREQAIPKGKGQLSSRSRATGAIETPDYDAENRKRKELGDKGEALVIAYEKKCLADAGRPDLANAICKVPDFEGYDILSFYTDGSKKYIEVKTTSGTYQRPFFWSWNEKTTMTLHKEDYWLYRLYNYDEVTDSADFYKLRGDFSNLILEEATQYRVHIK